MEQFKTVYKKFLVRVVSQASQQSQRDTYDFRIVFYTAATSEKHESIVTLDELSSIVDENVDASRLQFTPAQVHKLHEHMARTVPSMATGPTTITTQAEEEAKDLHGLLRVAMHMEKEGNLLGAIDQAKVCISSARQIKAGLASNGIIKRGPLEEGVNNSISQAYALLGSIYTTLGKRSKSLACYTLAAKIRPDSRIARDTVSAALADLAGVTSSSSSSSGHGGGSTDQYLEEFTITSLRQRAGFACNSCGDCCRTRRYIQLSPFDIYLMTRAPALSQSYRIQTTLDVHAQSSFYKGVFKWGRDERGLPTCYIDPSSEKAGHCRFAFPLFKKPSNNTAAGEGEGGDGDGDVTLAYEDSAEYLAFYGRSYERNEHAWEDKEQAAKWLEEEEGMELKYGDVYPAMNNSGKQALGCMLGSAGMPVACSSFPFLPEAIFADPDYGAGDMDLDDGAFVAVTGRCEGFTHNAYTSTRAGSSGSGSGSGSSSGGSHYPPNGDVGGYSYSPGGGSGSGKHEPAIITKLRGAASAEVIDHVRHEASRLEEWRWFTALRRALHTRLTADQESKSTTKSGLLRYPAIRDHLMHVLTQVWYNFDIIANSRRPIKSYSRLKRDLHETSWALVEATVTFFGYPGLAAAIEGGEGEGVASPSWSDNEVVLMYREMVSQLNTMKR